jgi:hypothetical protein
MGRVPEVKFVAEMLFCTAVGKVELILGTPAPLVTSTPLLPVVRPVTVVPAAE